jgi:hypothetical protein
MTGGVAMRELAGPVIAELIAKELDNARSSIASVQSRGLAVVTTSGTLVTLLFGFSAFVTKAQNYTLPSAAKLPLYLAAGLFVLAAVAGIVTNAPWWRKTIDVNELDNLIADPLWGADAESAAKRVAEARLTVVKSLRSANTVIAWILLGGIVLEILAIAAVTWAVFVLISTG